MEKKTHKEEVKKAVKKSDTIEQPVIPDVSYETLLNYITEIDKSGMVLYLKGLNSTHLKFEIQTYNYPIDGKYEGLGPPKIKYHEYRVYALVPLKDWSLIYDKIGGSLDGFVHYAFPNCIKDHIRFGYITTR
jgi:hypothetical protein